MSMQEGEQTVSGECCGNCKFYKINPQKVTEGTCRAHPPKVDLIMNPPRLMEKSTFPPVLVSEWCGEHVKKI